MRKVKEILRLHGEQKLSQREIAGAVQVRQSTVHEYLARAQVAVSAGHSRKGESCRCLHQRSKLTRCALLSVVEEGSAGEFMRMKIRKLVQAGLFLALATIAPAQRDSISKDFPIYDNGGKPDLFVDPKRLTSQMQIVDRYFEPGDCAIDEGVVGGSGYRRLLRFDVVLVNMGDGDLVVGNRSDPGNPYAPYFVLHQCHGHYHIKNFSIYELLTPQGGLAAVGTKQGFCFEDSFKYGENKSNGYHCGNQGITSGWGDWYYKQLVGQWIDITGVPEGEYKVRVSINTGIDSPIFDEGSNRYPNVIEVPIKVPNPRSKVDVIP